MKTKFTKAWILKNGIPIVEKYHGNLTLRALHYRLVALGMINDVNHYKKVVSSFIDARWENLVSFDAFLDHERETHGVTAYRPTDPKSESDIAKQQIKNWANSYRKNRWDNQEYYIEIFIEKKALQGVFTEPCREWDVALNPCKGYPSITFLYDAMQRFQDAEIDHGKKPLILYFGDYDCSGEDIPRSIGESLSKMGTDVEIKRIALMEQQVIDWDLPPAPTKATDSRSAGWDGLGQVELDAVEPEKIVELLNDALEFYFDRDLYNELLENEATEIKEFKRIIKRDFSKLI